MKAQSSMSLRHHLARPATPWFAGLLLCVVVSTGSCEFPGKVGGIIPDVLEPVIEAGQLALVEYPPFDSLAAYYCPMLYDSAAVETVCAAALGPRPATTDLVFRFELPIHVENTNDFPLPAVELLTALSVFPGSAQQELGAVCISFCDEEDPECASPRAGECLSDEPEINSIDDFAGAAVDLLELYIAEELTGGVPPELAVKTIPPGGTATIVVSFIISPEPILEIIAVLFEDKIADVVSGEDFDIVIPYQVDGSLWFVVDNFGKFGVNFGPLTDEWVF